MSAGAALPGVGWMLLSMSCIAIVDGIAKSLTREMNGVQVAWGYFLATLLALNLYAIIARIPYRTMIRSARPRLQVARAACFVLSLSALFFSLRYLPLAEATIISFTAPLFIVALAGPMLAETVTRRRWCAVLAGLGGAALVLRPGSELFQWPALVALVGAAFFALFNLVTRKIGAADRWQTTLMHSFVLGTALLSAAMPAVWVTPDWRACVTLALAGGLGLVAHLSLVRALTAAPASVLAPLSYVRLIWASGIGAVVFGDTPDAMTLLGGAVIIGSGLYVVRDPGPPPASGPAR